MNAGVSLVQAYLGLNGYLTVAEFPVIQGQKGGGYEEVTDLDVLGVRFPHAVHVIPRGRPGPEDDLRLEADGALGPAGDAVDVIIGEVKEGKARLNDATRHCEVLYAALSRVGCVPPSLLDRVITDLQARGEARVGPDETAVASRIRLMAFGDGKSGKRNTYSVLSLEQVAAFVKGYLKRYHTVLHPADLSDPVLGLLHLLRKLS
ncbi:MAG TPA: hypothetical protein VE173_06430 [Longimicrobiales bacterium]|nr:hypothetical protein [Longimicrobiales bacterium]